MGVQKSIERVSNKSQNSLETVKGVRNNLERISNNGCAERVGGVRLGSDSRRSCEYFLGMGGRLLGLKDGVEDGQGDALVLRWPELVAP